jgi:hypothetical protein
MLGIAKDTAFVQPRWFQTTEGKTVMRIMNVSSRLRLNVCAFFERRVSSTTGGPVE